MALGQGKQTNTALDAGLVHRQADHAIAGDLEDQLATGFLGRQTRTIRAFLHHSFFVGLSRLQESLTPSLATDVDVAR